VPTRPRRTRPAVRALLAGVLAAGMLLAPPVAAETPDPAPWPTAPGTDPGIDATAHSLRIAGPDRTQTAQSSALLLRGDGGYPFSTPDRTSGPGATLSTADGWWGLGTCPYAVIITAGDTAADSLAAASLSDPTNRSSEPELVRTASRDELLAPIGASGRVDTDSAPIIVTASARQGATDLSPAARRAVADLADGGCRTASAAIVVGGTAAVPAGVDQQLLGLGVDEVFRVAGSDRYATAGRIARALGTGPAVSASTPCADSMVTDGDARMGWYGNAAVELRSSATRCRVLGRTVVLTDGITGADALAAGWWTSTWQVPVLLVDGDGRMPSATLSALNSLVIDNVVVLGGRARVPDQTVSDVRTITGAEVHRVAGADRYATSVEMARSFGGWFATGDGADHDGSMVCLAASSGAGAQSVGWPDALGAGPWCGAAGGLASATPAPERGLAPVAGPFPRATRGLRPSHDAVPVLLTPAGSPQLAAPVAELLGAAFRPGDTWCSGFQASDACLDPGFVVAFGGTAVLSDGAVRQAARAVSGETYVTSDDRSPRAAPGFWTSLDLRPVYAQGGAPRTSPPVGCASTAVRWPVCAGPPPTRTSSSPSTWPTPTGSSAAVTSLIETMSPAAPAPARLAACGCPSPRTGWSHAVGASISGTLAPIGQFDLSPERRFSLSGAVVQDDPAVAEGADTTLDGDDGTTRLVFADDRFDDRVVVTSRGQSAVLSAATLDLDLRRGADPLDPDTFTGVATLSTSLGSVVLELTGEAIFDGDTWRLRGRSAFTGGTWNATEGVGGFSADLQVGDEGFDDDSVRWTVDGLLGTPRT
jgi:hypothetical protein